MLKTIEDVNEIIAKEVFFEFRIFNYVDRKLTIVGSRDMVYYHTLELYFQGVFSIIGNTEWHVPTVSPSLSIVTGIEAQHLNERYKVEQGNSIFKFSTDECVDTYVIAESVEIREVVVKYY